MGFKFWLSAFPWLQLKKIVVQIMAWCQTSDKPLPEQMMVQFTDAYFRLQAAMI